MLDRNKDGVEYSAQYKAGRHRAIFAALNGMPKNIRSKDPDFIKGYNENYAAVVKDLDYSEEERDYLRGQHSGRLRRRETLNEEDSITKSRVYEQGSASFKRGFREGIKSKTSSKKRSHGEMSQSDAEMPQSETESKRRKYAEYARAWKNGIVSCSQGAPLKKFAGNESEVYQQGWTDGHEYATSLRATKGEQAKKQGVGNGSSKSKQAGKNTTQNTIQDKQNRVMPITLTSIRMGLFDQQKAESAVTQEKAGEPLQEMKPKEKEVKSTTISKLGHMGVFNTVCEMEATEILAMLKYKNYPN